MTLYIKVKNLADTGDLPVPCGITITCKKREFEPSYEEFTAEFDKAVLLKGLNLDRYLKPEDIEFITKEEYEQLFGRDSESEED